MVGFINLDPFLGRPFSIVDEKDDQIKIIFNIRGRGTTILSKMQPGDIVNMEGPCGRALPEPKNKTVLIAGGMGVAPMLYYLKRYPQVHFIYGAKDSDSIIPIGDHKAVIYTEDGSVGNKGMATDGIKDDNDLVIACGPLPMLRRIKEIVNNGEAWGLFECRMGCGYGVCLTCAIPGYDKYIRLCTEGPAIPLKEVDFEAFQS